MSENNSLVATQELLELHFNLEELNDLSFRLGIAWDNIRGEILSAKCRELVLLLHRNGKMNELIDLARQKRPHVSWPNPSSLNQSFGASDPFAVGSAPPIPGLFVGRDKEVAELKERLMGKEDTTLLTAVRGWPGVGKTSLAAVIAHQEELKTEFPVVLWAALGQNPSVAAELGNWITALGSRPIDYPTVKARREHLAAMLRRRKALLIIDDVWDAAHVQPFLVGGSECRTLVTTREPEIARTLGLAQQNIYRLLELDETHSLQILKHLAPKAVAVDPEGTRGLIKALEGLPLALHVAGRLLAAEAELDLGVADLLDELAEGTLLLQEKAPADRADLASGTIPTVVTLLEHSTNRLDMMSRERFALLGLFVSKPATFSAPAVAAAWGVDDPRPTLRILVNRGLVEPISNGRYQLHALLADHAKSMWEPSQ